jgi:hypothetical protein
VINFEDDIIVTRDGEVKRIDEDVPIFKNSRTRTEYINPKNLSSNVPQPYRKPIS